MHVLKDNCKHCGRPVAEPWLIRLFYTTPLCPKCYDTWEREWERKNPSTTRTARCSKCDGTGRINGWQCQACGGEGEWQVKESPPRAGFGKWDLIG